jgi:TetR/AcrR family transcriptional regulator
MDRAMHVQPLRSKESHTTSKGQERADAILEVARATLARDGYAALSMRSVAQQAGISLSTVQHYYPSRDDLVEALLTHFLDRYQRVIEQRMAQAGDSPRMPLFASIIDLCLEELRSQISSGLFFEVAALAHRHPYAAQMFDAVLTRARRTVRNLIRDIVPAMAPAQCELRSALIVGQMVGVMTFISSQHPPHGELDGLHQASVDAIMRIAFAP